MISDEITKNLVNDIAGFDTLSSINNKEINISIADEVQSVDFFDPLYKILKITRFDYIDYHYISHNKYFDVFIFKDQDINTSNLYQLIVCNNYTQVIKFDQSNYSGRIIVSEFGNPGKVYSFYDGSVIVVEPIKPSNVYYQYI